MLRECKRMILRLCGSKRGVIFNLGAMALLTWGLPWFACTPNSRFKRSTMISRWSSPIPEMIVWPLSGSVKTRNVGSSCARRSWRVPAAIALLLPMEAGLPIPFPRTS